jgi:hypothetical protein
MLARRAAARASWWKRGGSRSSRERLNVSGRALYDPNSVSVARIALAVALPVGLIGVVSLVIAIANSRTGSSTDVNPSDGSQRQRIGFGIRGVGFFMSQGNEIEDYAYVWPYLAKICLGVAILALVVALVAWVTL